MESEKLMTTSEPYTGECKDCYQHVLSPECDGHGIRVGEPCPYGKPMEKQTTSEPTTGEIAEFLSRLSHMMLYQLNDARASEMIDFTARRLRELEEGKKEALGYLGCATEKEDKYKNTIAALTARAEIAEAERDAAKKWATSEWYYLSRGL